MLDFNKGRLGLLRYGTRQVRQASSCSARFSQFHEKGCSACRSKCYHDLAMNPVPAQPVADQAVAPHPALRPQPRCGASVNSFLGTPALQLQEATGRRLDQDKEARSQKHSILQRKSSVPVKLTNLCVIAQVQTKCKTCQPVHCPQSVYFDTSTSSDTQAASSAVVSHLLLAVWTFNVTVLAKGGRGKPQTERFKLRAPAPRAWNDLVGIEELRSMVIGAILLAF